MSERDHRRDGWYRMANLLNGTPKKLDSLPRTFLSFGEDLSFQVSWVGKRRQKMRKAG
jgi:hypothetical protein